MGYLYRGVSVDLYNRQKGQLMPKKIEEFTYTFHWNEKGLKWNSGAKWGSSETNAVIRHQLNQESFPTSGVSTTPHFERTRIYAMGKNGLSAGYVYKIDRSLLLTYGVREFVVSQYTKEPSIPEDDEVILVASDFGALPESIVIEIIPISAPKDMPYRK